MKNEALGIDISKQTFDVHLHVCNVHKIFKNNHGGFKELESWLQSHDVCFEGLIICFEHTGLYAYEIAEYLSEKGYDFVRESALQIKRSIGITRGKNDRVDAKRIAEYAFLRKSDLEYTKLPQLEIIQLQKLLTLRESFVKQRQQLKVVYKESLRVLDRKKFDEYFCSQERIVAELTAEIKHLERSINTLIQRTQQLKYQYELITSVKGVGLIVASNILVTTACFSRFKDPKKYACYCGVAPFEYSSGTSINYRTKVNPMANKPLKALLNLAARSAITSDPELKLYYARKVAEGKNKMSVLNAVRNKLIHRVFAVVKRGTPYVTLHKHQNNLVLT